MEPYISKSAVIAEIERRIEAHKETLKNCDSSISEMVLKGSMSAYQSLLHFFGTLEVKEVDLEKEIDDYFNEWQNVLCDEDCCNEGGFCCVLDENVKPVNIERCRKVAKHFFELGLKVQKGENNG